MSFLISLPAAAILVLLAAKRACAHQFTDAVKEELTDTAKYGAGWLRESSHRNRMTLPREHIFKNNFRSMSSYRYDIVSGVSFKDGYEEYDDTGKLTRSMKFDQAGCVIETAVYNYDKNGELVKLSSKTSSPKLNMFLLHRFDEDADGNWTFNFFSGENAAHPKEIFRYGKDGGLIEFAGCSKEGAIEYAVTYKYNKNYTETFPEPSDFAAETNAGNECARNMRVIAGCIELYMMEKNNEFPDGLEELLKDGYFFKIPCCPKNGIYSFEKHDPYKDCGLKNPGGPFFRIVVECSEHGSLY